GPSDEPPPSDECNPQIEACDTCPLKNSADKTNPILLYSGEKYEQVIDLRIKGVGMDFIWARTYGSKTGPNTLQGNGWDFSQNIQLFAEGSGVRLLNGGFRSDLYRPLAGTTNTWVHNGFFQEIQLTNGQFILVMADKKRVLFHSF